MAEDYVGALIQTSYNDNGTVIESHPIAVAYQSILDMDWSDSSLYNKEWVKEAENIQILSNLLKTGKQFLSFLYTYRSCARGIPQVDDSLIP